MFPLTALFTFFARVQTSIANSPLPAMEYEDGTSSDYTSKPLPAIEYKDETGSNHTNNPLPAMEYEDETISDHTNSLLPAMEFEDETSFDHTIVKPIRTHRNSLPGRPILKTSKIYWKDYDHQAYEAHKNKSATAVVLLVPQNSTNPCAGKGLKRSFSEFDHEAGDEREAEAMQTGHQMDAIERPYKRRRFNPLPPHYPSTSPANFNRVGMNNTKANSHCDLVEDTTASQKLYGIALPYTCGRISRSRLNKTIVKFAADTLDVNREESDSNVNSIVYADFREIHHRLRNWHQNRSAANGRLKHKLQKWIADIIDASETPEQIEVVTTRISEVDNDICDSPLYALSAQEADKAMASDAVAERLYWMDSVISRICWMTTERAPDPEDFWRRSIQTRRYEGWTWHPSPEVGLEVPSITVSPPSVEQPYDFSQPQTPMQDSRFGHQLTVSYCLNTCNVLPDGVQKGLALDIYGERLPFTSVPPFQEQCRKKTFAKIRVPLGENSTGCRPSSRCSECFPREVHPWPSFNDLSIWAPLHSWVDSLPTLLSANSQLAQPPVLDAQMPDNGEIDDLVCMFQQLNLGSSDPVEVSQVQVDAPKPTTENAPTMAEPPTLAEEDPSIDSHPRVEEPALPGVPEVPDAGPLPTIQPNDEGTRTLKRPRAARKRSAPQATSDAENEVPTKVRRIRTRSRAALEAIEQAAAVAAAKKSRRKLGETTNTQRKTWNLRPRPK